MATQKAFNGLHRVDNQPHGDDVPSIYLPPSFRIQPQDARLRYYKIEPFVPPIAPPPPLSVLNNFTGTFYGHGFNTIFRPNNGTTSNTTFPKPVSPAPPQFPNDNTLELNLTEEYLAFAGALGNVPNRGFGTQGDIFLNGVPYTQTVNDVTDAVTGKANYDAPSAIHFEPGLWMHVPATTSDPIVPESLNRMGSIPHGTTINAQCPNPIDNVGIFPTGPRIAPVDITPISLKNLQPLKNIFPSMTAANPDTARLPQDLSKFIAAGTITQAMLTDPTTVLRNAIVGQNIIKTIVFTVATSPAGPELGGGTANTGFLIGATSNANGPNAQVTTMTAKFWIETVQYEIEVPAWRPGSPAMEISAPAPKGNTSGVPTPTFLVQPPHEIFSPLKITVSATQIQYSQVVNLVFAGIIWPHASVATLVPYKAVPVPASAFGAAQGGGTAYGGVVSGGNIVYGKGY